MCFFFPWVGSVCACVFKTAVILFCDTLHVRVCEWVLAKTGLFQLAKTGLFQLVWRFSEELPEHLFSLPPFFSSSRSTNALNVKGEETNECGDWKVPTLALFLFKDLALLSLSLLLCQGFDLFGGEHFSSCLPGNLRIRNPTLGPSNIFNPFSVHFLRMSWLT